MHPYRESMRTKRAIGADREELLLYVLMAAIGAIPVAIALLRHATFGFDSTLGLVMVAIGVVGMCVQLARLLRKRAA